MNQGVFGDVFEFFQEVEMAVRAVPQLMTTDRPGQFTEAQIQYLDKRDAFVAMFVALMGLSEDSHNKRIAMENLMDTTRLLGMSTAEYKRHLMSHLATENATDVALAASSDKKKRPLPRLPSGEVDWRNVQCFKCQGFGHTAQMCTDSDDQSAAVSERKQPAEQLTLKAIRKLIKTEMTEISKTMRSEAEAADAAHYAFGGGIGAYATPAVLAASQDSDDD